MSNAISLATVRVNTPHDLSDIQALAGKLFARGPIQFNNMIAVWSMDLFIGVGLHVVYENKLPALHDLLDFLHDPSWEDPKQTLYFIGHHEKAFAQEDAQQWLKGYRAKVERISDEQAAFIVRRISAHWKTMFGATDATAPTEPPDSASATSEISRLPVKNGVAIFNIEALATALEVTSSRKEDQRGHADRILESAAMDGGYRSIPSPTAAYQKLEEAKSHFENLVDPISFLQTNLVLAAHMPPAEFRVSPILLLGEPGIGKTYLATQLADALGVKMEKISAGGAQGGFQLTGSHTGWSHARPGSIFTLLAEGKSATAVVVIDEVEKIHSGNYPVLPVLLDLFEPDTAMCFKDEYFDMQFDASRIVYVLTANSLDGVPSSLLSRVEIFDVPRPEPEQRLRIINTITEQLCKKTGKSIRLTEADSDNLAERCDIDLRKLSRIVRDAFAKALSASDETACLVLPKLVRQNPFGFMSKD